MPDLKERLAKLGFAPATTLPKPAPSKSGSLVSLVGGEKIIRQEGEVILVEHCYPYGSQYGRIVLRAPEQINQLSKFSLPDDAAGKPMQLFFVDTETTGLSGGTGTLPFLIGFGFFDEVGFQTRQLLLENPADEVAQLCELERFLHKFETTVSFNGKSFDLPILRTRFLINKLPSPFERFQHIDLLHIARKLWKLRLEDRSLKELEGHILGYSRSDDDLPGWMIPQVYFDFLRTGNAELLKNVIYHNEVDMVSMGALYLVINEMLSEAQGSAALNILDTFSLAKMNFQVGDAQKALGLFEVCIREQGTPEALKREASLLSASLHKGAGNFEEALPHWERAVALGSVDACTELAKYYEHRRKDLNEAAKWTTTALSLIEKEKMPRYQKSKLILELTKRLSRVKRSTDDIQEKES